MTLKPNIVLLLACVHSLKHCEMGRAACLSVFLKPSYSMFFLLFLFYRNTKNNYMYDPSLQKKKEKRKKERLALGTL